MNRTRFASGLVAAVVLALSSLAAPAFASEGDTPAPATLPATAPMTSQLVQTSALPVVGGAKSLSETEKKAVDGAMRCARITFTTTYYVLGYEVYRTSEDRWVCDPGVN
ncbi:MAG: hypothetical protein H7Z41_17735 [Cytophagales bacterium]|nr:hypothetical protein [Armatimonadota bacterium]